MTADQASIERLEEEIARHYPYPLAATYHNAFYGTSDLDEAHDYLLNLFEVMLKYLASIALGQYFEDEPNDPRINHDLAALRRPSLGHWLGWLRDILDFYARTKRPLSVPELASFYKQKRTDGLLQDYTNLRELMTSRMGYIGGKNLGVVTPQQIFELIGEYRNLTQHGVRPNSHDRKRAATILMPAMRELFSTIAFVAEYRLIYLDEVKRASAAKDGTKRYNYSYTTLMGSNPRTSPIPRELDNDDTEPEKTYLLAKNEEFKPLLRLYPFLIYRYCDSCNRYQAFVLNTSKNNEALEYISYQCTHRYDQSEYRDLTELLSSIGITADAENNDPITDEALLISEPQSPEIEQAGEETEPGAQEEGLRLHYEEQLAQMQAQLEVERQAREAAERQARQQREEKLADPLVREGATPATHDQERPAYETVESPRSEISSQETQQRVQPNQATHPSSVTNVTLLLSLEGHTNAITSVQFSPDGQILASGSVDRTIRVWRVSEGKLLYAVQGSKHMGYGLLRLLGSGGVLSIAFSPDGQILASGSEDKTVRLWRVSDGMLLHTLTGHIDWVNNVVFSPDGQLLASGSIDKTIRLWQVSDGMLLHTLTGSSNAVSSVAFSPDGQLLASGSGSERARLWRVSDGKVLHTLTGHTSSVNSIVFSPDGQLLASRSSDKTIRLWQVSDGFWLHTLTGHTSSVNSIVFSPDGQLLASGSSDKTVRLWQVWDGKLLHTLTGHTSSVYSIVFSPDGQLLASRSSDKTVRLWRVSDGMLLHALPGDTSSVRWVSNVVFSPDGQLLASDPLTKRSDYGRLNVKQLKATPLHRSLTRER